MDKTMRKSPAAHLPGVHPQGELSGQAQVSVLHPTLLAGPQELWILFLEPVHSDAPTDDTISTSLTHT